MNTTTKATTTTTTIIIKHRSAGITLFEGAFADIKHAVETALLRGARLDGADLRGANLSNAALDGADWRHVDLRGANLAGANISEAVLQNCDLRDANLVGTCLCETALRGCDLSGALCGATDIAGARLQECIITTSSALRMNFIDASAIEACAFIDEVMGARAPVTKPPIIIDGLAQAVVILDRHVRIGHVLIPRDMWESLANDNGRDTAARAAMDSTTRSFVRSHAGLMRAIGCAA